MSEMSYEENQSVEHDYSQDVCEPGDEQPAAPAPHEINDPPIEYDPIGQALLTLPLAAFSAAGEVVMEGASVVGAGIQELVAWGVSELGIGAAEHLTEDSGESETPAPEENYDDSYDAGTDATVQ